MAIGLAANVKPLNNAFTGLVDAKDIIGGEGNTVPVTALPLHNQLSGLDVDDYKHLTATEKSSISYVGANGGLLIKMPALNTYYELIGVIDPETGLPTLQWLTTE